MKLEIDIPSIIYNDAKENRGYISVGKMEIAWKAIADGKPLDQEPNTGYWIKYDREYFIPERLTPVIHSIRECSECHTRIADFCGEMKHCPNCGSKMIESQESEEEDGND